MKAPKQKPYIELCLWDEVTRITFEGNDITIDEAYEYFRRILLAQGFKDEQKEV